MPDHGQWRKATAQRRSRFVVLIDLRTCTSFSGPFQGKPIARYSLSEAFLLLGGAWFNRHASTYFHLTVWWLRLWFLYWFREDSSSLEVGLLTSRDELRLNISTTLLDIFVRLYSIKLLLKAWLCRRLFEINTAQRRTDSSCDMLKYFLGE